MKHARLFRWILLGIFLTATLLVVGIFFLRRSNAASATPTPAAMPQSDETQQIEQAIRAAIQAETQATPVYALFEHRIENIRISADGDWATAWLVPLEPDTGEPVPGEPGLVLVQRTLAGWKATLPSDPNWTDFLQKFPDDLISPEQKEIRRQEADVQAQALAPAAPLTGYKLPFPGGDTRRLTQSVAHDRYTPSGNAHYSFDFATAYPSAMFQVAAAKSGVVSRVRWTQNNGDPAEPGNYIVLEDRSTVPITYQLYLHLAKDSIPPELRVIGTPVRRGQYLGMADDTGVSTGHHLHFMVHTTSTSYWGRSVDITFEDVSINGGRPRITADLGSCNSTDVCTSTQSDYLSTNYLDPDPNPPIGNITAPQLGVTVAAPTLRIEGWAMDASSGLYSARLMANYNGSWQPISDAVSTNSLSFLWDMCADQVPDGPVSLALELRDKAFNQTPGLPGLTHFVKSYACPVTPQCVPGSSEVALFSEENFGGQCVRLSVGATSLGAFSDNSVVSVRVGSAAKVTLFNDANHQGRAETFTANDASLADNRLGPRTASSVLVQSRSAAPSTPIPHWPPVGYTSPTDGPLNLSWQDAGGGMEFQAAILLNNIAVQTSPWSSAVTWQPAPLAPGSYTWRVKARSGTTESGSSTARSLVISAAAPPPAAPPLAAPFEDTLEVERGWSGSLGWSLSTVANHTPGGRLSWQYAPAGSTYNTGAANAGTLVSPPIPVPAAGVHYLRFWYQQQTEGSNPHWDQRWVQISANGGPWSNVLQLHDDPTGYWLRSPAISLQTYANQTIRVRFYFATLDANDNNFAGWFIDDFSVTADPPPACGDADGSPDQANPIAYGASVSGVICPGGDVDYYRFSGSAGERIGAWIDAQAIASPLDSRLTLLDSDGSSLLAYNDDMLQYLRTDSLVTFDLPHDGVYYLKVQAWDHPTAGDANYKYQLNLRRDARPPAAIFTSPAGATRLSARNMVLSVLAADAESGISHVVFQAHASDWLAGGWTTLGEDWNGADGWSHTLTADEFQKLPMGAIVARAYDFAGNSVGIGVWNILPSGIYLPIIRR